METGIMTARIRLYDAGLGAIIQHPSGVLYTDQTCGVCCAQPEMEGVFVPFDAKRKVLARVSCTDATPRWAAVPAVKNRNATPNAQHRMESSASVLAGKFCVLVGYYRRETDYAER
ncbi:DUF6210 family protein [Sorangium sp. So ce296]|uniref:DUF6210 family protein n=1 Tax=Sorangium sp. So ce296 TaxID=3133296 RepID=UPI003F62365D